MWEVGRGEEDGEGWEGRGGEREVRRMEREVGRERRVGCN